MTKLFTHIRFTLAALFVLCSSVVMAQEGAVTIAETTLPTADGFKGEETVVGTVHITVTNEVTKATKIVMNGSNRAYFTATPEEIPATPGTYEVQVKYNPTVVGSHSALLQVYSQDEEVYYGRVSLKGRSADRNNMPTITVEGADALSQFTAVAGQNQQKTFTIALANAAENGTIALTKKDGNFAISSTYVSKWSKATITVTYKPIEAGTHTETLTISTYAADPVVINLSGTATAATAEEREGDDMSQLTFDHPVTFFNEGFDNAVKNKPLMLTDWVNLAQPGTRAFWGFDLPETSEFAGDKVAKATLFDSMAATETPSGMTLFTPAIDYANAPSKMFTFRIMGQYLRESQDEELFFYCLSRDEKGELVNTFLEGIQVPATADENEDWKEVHMDLSKLGKDLPNVFRIGVAFAGTRGRNSSVTYYLDDVAFGRTNIPTIEPSTSEVAFVAVPGQRTFSPSLTVNTSNIVNPVKLTLGGPNKSKFTLSTTEISAEGGTFQVAFQSDNEGVHSAYVKLASRGAADKYIALSVNNTTTTGVTALQADGTADVQVFDLQGRQLSSHTGKDWQSVRKQLRPGTYVVRQNGQVKKVVVR